MRETAYHVVTGKKTALVASGKLPEQSHGDKSREKPEDHDIGSHILKLGRNVWSGEHEEGGKSSVGNAISCS